MIRSDINQQVIRAAGQLLAYHRLGETPAPADGLLAFGSNDPHVAEHAARLVLEGLAPWVMFSAALPLAALDESLLILHEIRFEP